MSAAASAPGAAEAGATPAAGLMLSNLIPSEAFTVDLLIGSALILGSVGIAAWPGRRR